MEHGCVRWRLEVVHDVGCDATRLQQRTRGARLAAVGVMPELQFPEGLPTVWGDDRRSRVRAQVKKCSRRDGTRITRDLLAGRARCGVGDDVTQRRGQARVGSKVATAGCVHQQKSHLSGGLKSRNGGRCRVRTCDPCRVKAMLYR